MDGQGEVGDELGSGDEEKEEDDAWSADTLARWNRRTRLGRKLPDETVHHPAETEHPASRDIAPYSAPAEEQVGRDLSACDQRGEEDESGCYGVV